MAQTARTSCPNTTISSLSASNKSNQFFFKFGVVVFDDRLRRLIALIKFKKGFFARLSVGELPQKFFRAREIKKKIKSCQKFA